MPRRKPETFGERLRYLRLHAGLSQVELGELAGVSKSHMCQWEREFRVPDFDSILNLADALKVTTDELMGRSRQSSVRKLSVRRTDN